MRRGGGRAATALFAILAGTSAGAQEFRNFQPIPAPSATGSLPLAGSAAVAPGLLPAPSEDMVWAGVAGLLASWNTPNLGAFLSEEFHDQTRLPETLAATVPRDARLRVLAIEGWSTLGQREEAVENPWAQRVVSTVSVVVRSQVEFNDPERGFQRLEGRNEYVFDVEEVVPR